MRSIHFLPNNSKVPKKTQSTEPNQWPGIILSPSTTGLRMERILLHLHRSPNTSISISHHNHDYREMVHVDCSWKCRMMGVITGHLQRSTCCSPRHTWVGEQVLSVAEASLQSTASRTVLACPLAGHAVLGSCVSSCHQSLYAILHCGTLTTQPPTLVCSLLQAEDQPTLDLSAETI